MKSVSDLSGFRRTLPSAFGVRSCSVTADDLHCRMIMQPFGKRVRFAIRQQVDGLPTFKIHQNRSVAMTPPPRPIIDAEHSHVIVGFIGARAGKKHTQDGVSAGAKAQLGREPMASRPAESVPDCQQSITMTFGLSAVRCCQTGEPLCEDPASTSILTAVEPPGS
jgi:hypothetical protein